jgi:general secretion pathway protein A
VLLFDDADTLSEPMFRFLHDVLDLSYRTATSLSLVLLGQLGQWPGLGDPDLGALRQATMSRHFIPALAPEESRAYLDHRLAEAGRPPHRIMTRAAVLALVDCAGGVPGQIDALAQLALVHGYRWRRRRITARLVRRALSDPAGLRAPAMPRPRFLLAAGIGAGALALAALGGVLGWQAERAPVSPARLPVIVARGPGPTDRAAARAPQAPPLPAPTPRPAQPRPQAPAGQAPSADGGPGLVLVARPGDSLEKLYTSVYRGMTPPPFQAVLALNQGPLRPGTLLIFPAPPGGWASYRRARSPSG